MEYHTIPLWSPTILSGYPFSADPLSGLWYPPGWLALIFPLPLGFNLLVGLHLVWGGVGMYRLLRSKGMIYVAALFGGLAFESYPKIFAHFGAGHLTLLYAIPWTPWLLLAEGKRNFEPGKLMGRQCNYRPNNGYSRPNKTFLQRLFAPGVILALIFLADPRWAAYAAILWLGYGIANRHKISSLLGQTALAALLSAPLALPLLEYTRISTRTNLRPDEVLAFSLPPARLLGFIYPDFGGYQEWVLYAGGMVLILSMLAVIWKGFRGWVGFWGIVTIVSILISLGSYVPGLSVIARIPGLGLLRVPPRALFLTGFSLAVLAASGLDTLLANPSTVDKRKASWLLVGMSGFALTLTTGVWALTNALPLSFAWGTAVILAGSVWMGLFFVKRIPIQVWLVGLVGLSLVDWSRVDLSEFAYRKEASVLSEGASIGAHLAEQAGFFRVYSPSYSLPQHIAALCGIELADGVDPLQPRSYARFMEKATGVPVSGYSVTMPPFEDGDPNHANANYRPDPALLGLLNVRYVVSDFDLPVDGLALRERFGETRIYQNMKELPRAWVQNSDELPSGDSSAAEITAWSPNQIDVRANGPGLLVLSEIAYPGWRVLVDGNLADIEVAYGLLRAVRLDEGVHEVEFLYRPVSVYVGLGLWAIGILLVLAGLI